MIAPRLFHLITQRVCFTWLISIVMFVVPLDALYAQGNSFRITTDALDDGVTGLAYSFNMSAMGGSPPRTWTASGLPSGLSISLTTGAIRGTTNSIGTFSVTITVKDAQLSSATKTFTLTIVAPLSITTTSLPSGRVESAYSATLDATGGTSPYTWAVSSGSMPPGLSLSGRTVTGTPTRSGTFAFTVQVTDKGDPTRKDSRDLSIRIDPMPVVITTTALSAGVVGNSYSQNLAATGGVTPYRWSVSTGSLPSGLSLAGNSISGTPSVLGIVSFSVTVLDASDPPLSNTRALSITIQPALSITTTSLPGGTVGVIYSQTFAAANGTPPYSWSVASGTLASGLSLSSTGVLTGTPTASGSYTFAVRVTDSGSSRQTATRTLTLVIANPAPPPIPSLSLTGLPGSANPTDQIGLALVLSGQYPTTLSGTLTMSFVSNAAIPVDDPAVRFSTGSRTVSFTIPANTTQAVFQSQAAFQSPVALLIGTVSGTVNLTASVQGSAGSPVGSVAVRSLAPRITNVSAVRRPGGLEIQAIGYSPERRVINIEFGFDIRTAAGVMRIDLSRNVQTDFEDWYRNPSSSAFGSAFRFNQLFIVQGDSSAIQSVVVSFTNEQGRTSSVPVQVEN